MTDDYTPTTAEVRNNTALGVALAALALHERDAELTENIQDVNWPYPDLRENTKVRFDEWLRQERERIWNEAYTAAVEEDFLAEDFVPTPNPYSRKED